VPVPGSTALAGREGPPELLSAERIPGNTTLVVGEHAHCNAEVRGALAHRDVLLQEE
jgi:hypothetical protein